MFRSKKILFSACVTLLLTFVLAVPGSALDVSTEINHFYFSVNGSALASCGNYVSGAQISGNVTTTGNVTVSSYSFLVPFTAPCESLTLCAGMWTGPITSAGTYVADWGVIAGGKYYKNGSVPVSFSSGTQETYSYGLDSSSSPSYRVNRYYTFDLSGVDAQGGANCFVRLSYSGTDFPLRTHLKALNGLVAHGTATFKSTTAQLPTYSSSTSGNSFIAKATSALSGTIDIPNLHTWQETDNLAPITLSAMRNSDDRKAVAELQKINGTLDGMAANLQTITDDFKAREDVGNDISGVTTDDQIANGNSGMTTGSSSISQAISGLPSFSTVVAPATGFISFLTSPVQSIFDFGNGYLLYIATVMVLLSVIFWIIKRMGGDS
jgi:hypothetical protein